MVKVLVVGANGHVGREVVAQLLDAGHEVRAMVRGAIDGGAENPGMVMKAIAPRLKGRFEGKEANRIAREELGV